MRRIAALLLVFVVLTAQAGTEPAEFTSLVAAHNAARHAVAVAPLAWSDALASDAQHWADQLAAENCQLRYDPDPKRRESTGQNLFRAYANAPYQGYKRSGAEAAARWLREGDRYDHVTQQCKPGLDSQCGAYLQVIWEATTALGCGRARCAAAEVWACHYAPRGGQVDLKPYGNAPQASPVAEAVPVQECSWQGPSPAQQLGDALIEKLQAQ